MKILPRYGLLDWMNHKPFPDKPFVYAVKHWDIPKTMVGVLTNPRLVNSKCVAVTLRCLPDFRTLWVCERAARQGGFRILWMKTGLENSDKVT